MGTEVKVREHPDCDFCRNGTKAEYDFATRVGPWANGCTMHYEQQRASPTLGTGRGQKLILAKQEKVEPFKPSSDIDDEAPPKYGHGKPKLDQKDRS